MKQLLISFSLTIVIAVCLLRVNGGHYEGYKKKSIKCIGEKQCEYVNHMNDIYPQIDFWVHPSEGQKGIMVVPPEQAEPVEKDLTDHHIQWDDMPNDLDEIIKKGSQRNYVRRGNWYNRYRGGIDHTNYHSYWQIRCYLRRLKWRFPRCVQLTLMNERTFEGRPVAMVKLFSQRNKRKPSILIEAGQHAREWIAPSSTLYFMEKLLERYTQGEETAKLMLENYNWYIIPMANPDGYEYSRRSPDTRLWRKNRRQFPNKSCVGVDPNRNFETIKEFHIIFDIPAAFFNCSSLEYRGEKPFSEPESRNTRNLFHHLNDTLVAFLSIHSFTYLYLTPPISMPFPILKIGHNFGAYPQLPHLITDTIESVRVSTRMSEWVANKTGSNFAPNDLNKGQPSFNSPGTSGDWAILAKPGVYSYIVELRPSLEDGRGFVLPPSEIIPSGEDLYHSIFSLCDNMDQDVIQKRLMRV